jgi:ribosomal protein S18 acetylase RimI-like enzyme
MTLKENTKIILTTDPEKIKVCAMMMSKTDPWITLEMDYKKCLKAFEGQCKEIYVVEAKNNIIGFVILQVCGSFAGYIQTICIGTGHRGKGYGTKLLQFCEDRILKISPNIFICVSSFNKGALRLYKDFGFRQIGELENFVKEGFTELLMRKTFGPREGFVLR